VVSRQTVRIDERSYLVILVRMHDLTASVHQMFVSPRELARLLGVAETTVRRWGASLGAVRFGGRVFVPLSRVREAFGPEVADALSPAPRSGAER